MQIAISGQHLSIGSALQGYVQERLQEKVTTYFDKAPDAHVNFSKQGYNFFCDIIVNDGTGRHTVVKADASSNDIYSSFDIALVTLERQLRKYKSRLKDRHNRLKLSQIPEEAIKYTIASNVYSENTDSLEVEDMDKGHPAIIAEKPTTILSLSLADAVMQMDLENLPALMFKNVKTNRINVVYYRKDGNISWVDSK